MFVNFSYCLDTVRPSWAQISYFLPTRHQGLMEKHIVDNMVYIVYVYSQVQFRLAADLTAYTVDICMEALAS